MLSRILISFCSTLACTFSLLKMVCLETQTNLVVWWSLNLPENLPKNLTTKMLRSKETMDQLCQEKPSPWCSSQGKAPFSSQGTLNNWWGWLCLAQYEGAVEGAAGVVNLGGVLEEGSAVLALTLLHPVAIHTEGVVVYHLQQIFMFSILGGTLKAMLIHLPNTIYKFKGLLIITTAQSNIPTYSGNYKLTSHWQPLVSTSLSFPLDWFMHKLLRRFLVQTFLWLKVLSFSALGLLTVKMAWLQVFLSLWMFSLTLCLPIMTKQEKVTLNPNPDHCGSHLAQRLDTVWINTRHSQGHRLRGVTEALDPDDGPHAQRPKLEHLARVEGPTFVLLGWQRNVSL